jgi:hypothetical protein
MEELKLIQVSHFRKSLLKEKDQYSWQPTFHTENYVFLFFKLPILMRRSTVLNLPIQ